MKKLFSILALSLICSTVFSQGLLITDADLDTLNPLPCAGVAPPNFFDSGTGIYTGNYGANENETITVCPDYAGGTSKLSLTVSNGAPLAFDVDGSDTLFVYDGLNTSAPLLGAYNSITHPLGFNHISSFINNPKGCLTVQFVSDGANEGTGWDASFTCIQLAQPFEIHMAGYHNGGTNIITPIDTGYSDVCFGDSILFVASPVFPNSSDVTGVGYSQNNTNITYKWEFSDGTTANTPSVWFTPPARNGYVVSLKITDQFPYSQTITSKVRVSTIPSFSGVLINRDEICVGDTTAVIGAVTNTDTSGVDPTTSSFQIGGSVAGQVYLPDGGGVSYHDTINIAGFVPGDTVTNVTDLQQLCLNMEHSYLGDLEMQLTCPNGNTITIFNSNGGGLIPGGFNGGNTFLGHPIDDFSGPPGAGEEYCWSSTMNTYGDFPTEFGANNFITLTTPTSPSAGNSMNWNGIYAPEESFINLVGCPLNGDWSITVRDNLTVDDGYIFEWSILFDPIINPNNETYVPTIDTSNWLSAATVLPGLPNDTFIVVSANSPGPQNYTFEVTDNFGCDYDTTVTVQFNENPSALALPGNNTVCQRTTVDFDVTGNAATGFSYLWSPGHNLSDSTIQTPALTTDTLDGTTTYTVLVTNTVTGCTTDSFQEITVIPGYALNSTQSDTNICDGDVINFTTSPTLLSSYNYNWTANTAAFGTPTDSITTGTFNTTGFDTVIVSVSEGTGPLACVRRDTLYVHTATIPTIDIASQDTIICINGTATLYAVPLGNAAPFTLNWDNGLIGNGPHNVNPTADSTTYTVYVLDNNGCMSNPYEIVIALFQPITIQTLDLMRPTVCEGDTTLLKATAIGGGTNLIYTWLNGNNSIIGATTANQFIVTPSFDGEIFSVIVSDSCTTPSETMSVNSDWQDPIFPIYEVDSAVFCYDQFEPTFTNLTSTMSTIINVQWDFDDGIIVDLPVSNQITYQYNNSGTYNVKLTVTDQIGCPWDTIMPQFVIDAQAYPIANFLWSPNPTDYLNSQITFENKSQESLYNQWIFITDAQYTSSDIAPVFQFPQDQPGNYEVTLKVTSKIGCQSSTTKTVIINDVFLAYIPTGFTPNGDGLNDTFKIVGEGLDLSNFKMTIFNQWGELVFESSNPNIGWNGTQNGSLVPNGVYIWKIDAQEAHSPTFHRKDGFVTIMK